MGVAKSKELDKLEQHLAFLADSRLYQSLCRIIWNRLGNYDFIPRVGWPATSDHCHGCSRHIGRH